VRSQERRNRQQFAPAGVRPVVGAIGIARTNPDIMREEGCATLEPKARELMNEQSTQSSGAPTESQVAPGSVVAREPVAR